MTESELKLGGDELDTALRMASFGPASARDQLFARLLNLDLVVPVEQMPGEIDAGTALPVPLVTSSEGLLGFPLFTRPERLKEFATLAGWSNGEAEPHYLGMNAQGAFHIAHSTEAHVAVVDPGGPFPLVITRDEASSLSEGRLPPIREPAPAAATPPVSDPEAEAAPLALKSATPPPTRPSTKLMGIQSEARLENPTAPMQPISAPPAGRYGTPTRAVPSRVTSVLKVLMQQYPKVKMAVLYEFSETRQIYLGLSILDDAKPEPILSAAGEAILRLGLTNLNIETRALSPDEEMEVTAVCKPFFTR